MPSKVGLGKRAHHNDLQTFRAGGLQSGFDEGACEMLTTERRRNLRVHECQAVRRPLVAQKRQLSVHHELESMCGAVVLDYHIPIRRDIGPDPREIIEKLRAFSA